jgi:hypothetical protein
LPRHRLRPPLNCRVGSDYRGYVLRSVADAGANLDALIRTMAHGQTLPVRATPSTIRRCSAAPWVLAIAGCIVSHPAEYGRKSDDQAENAPVDDHGPLPYDVIGTPAAAVLFPDTAQARGAICHENGHLHHRCHVRISALSFGDRAQKLGTVPTGMGPLHSVRPKRRLFGL